MFPTSVVVSLSLDIEEMSRVTYYQLKLYHEISMLDERRSPDDDFMIVSYELKHSFATSRRFIAVIVEGDLVWDEK